MKKLFSYIFLILFCSAGAFSQDSSPDAVQALQKQIPPLLEQKKLDDVVPIAEKIVGLEKRGGDKNIGRYIAAVRNLALWKNQRISARPRKGVVAPYSKYQSERNDVEELFRELLVLAKKTDDGSLLSMTQADLAYFLAHHYGKWIEIEGLLNQSLAYRDREGQDESDSTIHLVDTFSRMYLSIGEIEKFIPLNRRSVATIEKKYGNKSKRLVEPLICQATVLFVTGHKEKAAELGKRISGIAENETFKPEPLREVMLRAVSKVDRFFGRTSVQRSVDFSVIGASVDSRIYSGVPGPVIGPGIPSAREITYSGSQTFIVDFIVDESGNVESAALDPQVVVAAAIKDKIIKRVLTWKFRPFEFEGARGKMHGRATVYYYN